MAAAGRFARALPLVALLLVVAAALAVPFRYETMTLWYKVGSDKTILRLGQLVGLLALLALFLQLLLGSRVPPLAGLYGVPTLMRLHRGNGVLLVLMALAHVFLVLLPEGLGNLPLAWKYWPELIGAFLLALLLLTVLLSQYRQQLGLAYPRWHLFHRVVAYLALPLATGHVLFVCESFQAGLPRTGLLLLAIGVAAWLVLARLTLRRGSEGERK
jgi:predicted ferric reductase